MIIDGNSRSGSKNRVYQTSMELELSRKINQLTKANEVLKNALDLYADKDNWEEYAGFTLEIDGTNSNEANPSYFGFTANKALEKYSEIMKGLHDVKDN